MEFIKINFENKNDFALFREFYDEIYVPAFPDEDERESLENIVRQNEKFRRNKDKGIEHYCIVAVLDGRVAGGIIGDHYLHSLSGDTEDKLELPHGDPPEHGTIGRDFVSYCRYDYGDGSCDNNSSTIRYRNSILSG